MFFNATALQELTKLNPVEIVKFLKENGNPEDIYATKEGELFLEPPHEKDYHHFVPSDSKYVDMGYFPKISMTNNSVLALASAIELLDNPPIAELAEYFSRNKPPKYIATDPLLMTDLKPDRTHLEVNESLTGYTKVDKEKNFSETELADLINQQMGNSYVLVKSHGDWELWSNEMDSTKEFLEWFKPRIGTKTTSNGFCVSSGPDPITALLKNYVNHLETIKDRNMEDSNIFKRFLGESFTIYKKRKPVERDPNDWVLLLPDGDSVEGEYPLELALKALKEVYQKTPPKTQEDLLAEQINSFLEDRENFDCKDKYILLHNESEWQVWRNLTESREDFLKELAYGDEPYAEDFGWMISHGFTPLEAFINATKGFLDWHHNAEEQDAEHVEDILEGLGQLKKLGEDSWEIVFYDNQIITRGISPTHALAKALKETHQKTPPKTITNSYTDWEIANKINRLIGNKCINGVGDSYVIVHNDPIWEVWHNELDSTEDFVRAFYKEGKEQLLFGSNPMGFIVSSGDNPIEALVGAARRFHEWFRDVEEISRKEVQDILGGLGEVEKYDDKDWRITLKGEEEIEGVSPAEVVAKALKKLLEKGFR